MRALPVGDRALLVEVSTDEEAQALHADLLRRRAEGSLSVREIVPAARTVLLDGMEEPSRLAAQLSGMRLPSLPPPVAEVEEERRMGMRRKETRVAMIGQGFFCQQQQDAIDISRLSFVAA
jgi:hypothetical protein